MLWTDGFVFVFEDSRLTAARQANDGHGLMMTRPSSITCQVLHTSDDHGYGVDELNDDKGDELSDSTCPCCL